MKIIKNKNWIPGKSYKKRILVEGLKSKINLIEDVIVESKGKIPIHSHNFTDEIFYITEGSATMIINEKEFEVNPGDMIYVDKEEEHGFRNESEKDFKMLCFKINFKKGDSYLK